MRATYSRRNLQRLSASTAFIFRSFFFAVRAACFAEWACRTRTSLADLGATATRRSLPADGLTFAKYGLKFLGHPRRVPHSFGKGLPCNPPMVWNATEWLTRATALVLAHALLTSLRKLCNRPSASSASSLPHHSPAESREKSTSSVRSGCAFLSQAFNLLMVIPFLAFNSRSRGSTIIRWSGYVARAVRSARRKGEQSTFRTESFWKSAGFAVNLKASWRFPVDERRTSPSLTLEGSIPSYKQWLVRSKYYGMSTSTARTLSQMGPRPMWGRDPGPYGTWANTIGMGQHPQIRIRGSVEAPGSR